MAISRPESRQPLVICDEAIRQQPDLHDRHDEVVHALQVANVTAAVIYGLRVTDACIRQVLTNGTGPLGPKLER